LEHQLANLHKQIDLAKKNERKFAKTLEEYDSVPKLIIEQLTRLELEIVELTAKINSVQYEILKPTVQEVSIDEVYSIVSNLSKLLPIVAPDKQKNLLHSVINKITFTQADNPKDRRIKDIELVFDASKEPNRVLTCDTVHRE
jgi:site-specific DNA recombinase